MSSEKQEVVANGGTDSTIGSAFLAGGGLCDDAIEALSDAAIAFPLTKKGSPRAAKAAAVACAKMRRRYLARAASADNAEASRYYEGAAKGLGYALSVMSDPKFAQSEAEKSAEGDPSR
jgi:hypothetical protein